MFFCGFFCRVFLLFLLYEPTNLQVSTLWLCKLSSQDAPIQRHTRLHVTVRLHTICSLKYRAIKEKKKGQFIQWIHIHQ